MKKIIIIFVLIISPLVSNSGDMEFYKEELNFTIKDDDFIVDNIYYFRNKGHEVINQNLLYSFPLSNIGKVDSIYVYDLDNKKEIEYRKVERFGTFNINLVPFSSGKTRVYYRQKITSDFCKYIFKSSTSWNRPVESTSIQLRLTKDIKIDSISYNIDSTNIIGKENIYYWEFQNFSPNKNFEFRFHKDKVK